MIRFYLFMILIGGFLGQARAQQRCLTPENLRALDAAWEKAQLDSDVETLQSMLAEEFLWVHNHASTIDDKAAVLDRARRHLSNHTPNANSRISRDLTATVSGATGIVSGYTVVDREPGPVTYHFMRTYVEREGKCYLLANQTMAIPSGEQPGHNPLVDNLKRRWQHSKEYTLAVFDAMPPDLVEYRPSARQYSFAQHFLHLGFINITYMRVLLDSKTYPDVFALLDADSLIFPPDQVDVFQPADLEERDPNENKAMVRQYLSDTFDYVLENLEKVSDDMLTQGKDKEKPDYLSGHTNLDLILRGESHTAHHRAQAITYLRANGVQPPGYSKYNKF